MILLSTHNANAVDNMEAMKYGEEGPSGQRAGVVGTPEGLGTHA